jgi:hypothetical protein
MQFHSSLCPRRVKALLCCAASLALGAFICCKRSEPGAAAPAAALRPLNLVVVTIDTLRPDHLHCYGYPAIETPTLDGIAQAPHLPYRPPAPFRENRSVAKASPKQYGEVIPKVREALVALQ